VWREPESTGAEPIFSYRGPPLYRDRDASLRHELVASKRATPGVEATAFTHLKRRPSLAEKGRLAGGAELDERERQWGYFT